MSMGTREIALSRGLFAIIDAADYPMISTHKWCAKPHGLTHYAVATINRKRVYMHVLIAGYRGVDHKNRNGVDNRRANLRPATQQQNTANRTKSPGCKSRFKGVMLQGDHARKKPWRAVVKFNGKKIRLGYFETEELAAQAYAEKASELFGEFAHQTDFPGAHP